MKKTIIEKLGITPGPWCVNFNKWVGGNLGFCTANGGDVPHSSRYVAEAFSGEDATEESKANDALIAAAPEMLEALIESVMKAEELNAIINEFDDGELSEIIKSDKRVTAIKKATGKTWEEIKSLIEED
jgi:hypothetical protein